LYENFYASCRFAISYSLVILVDLKYVEARSIVESAENIAVGTWVKKTMDTLFEYREIISSCWRGGVNKLSKYNNKPLNTEKVRAIEGMHCTYMIY
jgi:hypothetical protein